jgi:chemotaxis protein methyltransferase CheR
MLVELTTPERIDPSLHISPRSFGRLAEFVNGELGIKMPESKIPMIQSRLLRRVRALRLPSIDDYCEYLFSPSGGEAERVHFINAVTTNKTDFFREPQHFKYLTETALGRLDQSASVRRISVWSAACSSGEEPYTLAMVLSEYAACHPGFDFRILATDISTKVLKLAREAVYAHPQVAPVPRAMRQKYLLQGREGDHQVTRVVPELRRKVSFHQLNFMDADYRVRDMFEVIFCRNVLIYFDRPTQEAVINKLCHNLASGGFLFISHSETLSGLNVPVVSMGMSCYRKTRD